MSSFTSRVVDLGRPLLATRGAKFPCSQRQQWMLTNVFLSGHHSPGYFSWYKQATTALPPTKPYMNTYRLALEFSRLSQQVAITTHLTHNYCTLHLLRCQNFPRLCRKLKLKLNQYI
jgi:hypothetical protein